MKTDIMAHCGNAPKMQRVIDLTIALAKRDEKAVQQHVREDFVWSTVGTNDTLTYDELAAKLPARPAVKKLTVTNAMSHGNAAMCEGELVFEDGDTLLFCNVVQYTSTAKDAFIKEAHTYFVKKS